MEQNQILEAKIKALEELIEIQRKIIDTLKTQPQIQYIPYYQQPYYWPNWNWQYFQGVGGILSGGVNGQVTLTNGSDQGQLCTTQGSLSLAK